jgi:hypothetical protein
MSRGRLRALVACCVFGVACQSAERVYFELPGGTGGDRGVASGGTATGGALANGGSPTSAGGGMPVAGGAPDFSGGVSTITGGAATVASGGQVAASGGASGSVDFTKQFSVCSDLMVAQCRRRAECGEAGFEACLAGTIPLCPEVFFAPGMRATVDRIESCTQKWKEVSCQALADQSSAVCEWEPGERKLGEACSFSSQCAEGVCSQATPRCGSCVPIVNEGESCAVGVAVCDSEHHCSQESKTCVPGEAFAPLPLGADCGLGVGGSCEEGLGCFAVDETTRTCQRKIRLGEPCGVTSECLDGYCDDDIKICMAVPGLGMTCALQGRHPERSCAGGSVCDAHVEPPVCVTPVTRAQPCWVNPKQANGSTCSAGLRCDCTDATCSARHCAKLVAPGEDCSFAAYCPDRTECRDGRCQPLGEPQPEIAACGS